MADAKVNVATAARHAAVSDTRYQTLRGLGASR